MRGASPGSEGAESLKDREVSVESDESRLTRMFVQYHSFVWRLMRRFGLDEMEADDAAQETFMVVLSKFEVIDVCRERSYLYGTALRVSRNAVRRRAKQKVTFPVDEGNHVSPEPLPDAATELSQRCALLDSILAELPERVSRVMILSEIEQLPATEIALLEQIPVGTVASRLRKGRELVRKKLEQHGSQLLGGQR